MSENTRFALLTFGVVLVVGIAAWFMFGGAADDAGDVVAPAQFTSERPEEQPPDLPEFDSMSEEQPVTRRRPSTSRPRPARAPEPAPSSGIGKITGTVSVGETDVPRQIEVSLYQLNWERFESPRDDGLLLTRTVSADEKFEFTDLPLGRYVLQARGDGATGDATATLSRDRTTRNVTIPVYKAGLIRGRILDSSGKPIEDAYAYVSKYRLGGNETTVSQGRAAYSRTWSDDTGYYELDSVQVRTNAVDYQIAATAPGYTTEISDFVLSKTKSLDFELTKGGSVSGTVIHADSSDSVPNVKVVVDGETPLSIQSTVSDDEGNFTLDGLREGPLNLDIIHDTLIAVDNEALATVREDEEASGVELKVALGGTITGQVIDTDVNQGVPQAELNAYGRGVSVRRELKATTDAAGYYELTGLKDGEYEITLREVRGYPRNSRDPSSTRREVAVALSEIVEQIDFELRKGIQIGGYVVDSEGSPVANANVNANSTNGGSYESATADADGSFLLGGLQPSTTYRVSARKEGFATTPTDPVKIELDSVFGVEIEMEPPGSIEGIVVNNEGKPQGNVRVLAWDQTRSVNSTSEATGSDGRFTVTSLSQGEYSFQFSRGNTGSYQSTQQTNPTVKLESGETVEGIRLVSSNTEGETIAGRVTTVRGDAIASAQIQFQGPGWNNISTNSEGRFEAENLTPGTYTLMVSHGQHSQTQVSGILTETYDVLIKMRGRGSIEGRAFDASTRKPLERFSVLYHKSGTQFNNYMNDRFKQFSDPEGYFEITNVEEGGAVLIARAPGYARTTTRVEGVTANEVVRDVRLYLEAESHVEGIVINASGQPVGGAMIFEGVVPPYNRDSSVRTYTNRDGEFRLEELPSGVLTISAFHNSYAPSSTEVNIAPNSVARPEIVLYEGGEIVGRVTLNGEPVAGTHVSVNFMSGQGYQNNQNQRTDDNGEYRIAGLPDGEAMVYASVPNAGGRGRSKNINAEVALGSVTTVDFDFKIGTASIYGHVLDQEGEPVAGFVTAQVQTDSGMEGSNAQTDGEGYYIIENLPGGTVSLSANMTGNSSQSMRGTSIELSEGASVQQDFHMGGGSTIHLTVANVPSWSNNTAGLVLRGEVDLSEPSMELFQELQNLMVVAAQMQGGGATLEGVEPGTYTVASFAMDASDPSPFDSMQIVYKVVTVEENQDELSVSLSF